MPYLAILYYIVWVKSWMVNKY